MGRRSPPLDPRSRTLEGRAHGAWYLVLPGGIFGWHFRDSPDPIPRSNCKQRSKTSGNCGWVQFRSRERCTSVPVLRKKVELLSCASRRFRLETLFVMDVTQDWRRDETIAIQFQAEQDRAFHLIAHPGRPRGVRGWSVVVCRGTHSDEPSRFETRLRRRFSEATDGTWVAS